MTQGKRINGMIIGAMSDRSVVHRLDQWRPGLNTDVETYRTDANSDDIDCRLDPFNTQPQRMYIAHRMRGDTHDQAMTVADRYFRD